MRRLLPILSIDVRKEDRLFVYAVASWMTRLDGTVAEAETEALAKLGDALKIPERPRFHADSIAQEVAHMEEGDRPSRYDLPLLRKIIGERLKEAHARRLESATQDLEMAMVCEELAQLLVGIIANA